MAAIINFMQMALLYALAAFLVVAVLVLVFMLIYLSDRQKATEKQHAEREEIYRSASSELLLNAMLEARRKKHRRQITREEIIDALIVLQG